MARLPHHYLPHLEIPHQLLHLHTNNRGAGEPWGACGELVERWAGGVGGAGARGVSPNVMIGLEGQLERFLAHIASNVVLILEHFAAPQSTISSLMEIQNLMVNHFSGSNLNRRVTRVRPTSPTLRQTICQRTGFRVLAIFNTDHSRRVLIIAEWRDDVIWGVQGISFFDSPAVTWVWCFHLNYHGAVSLDFMSPSFNKDLFTKDQIHRWSDFHGQNWV